MHSRALRVAFFVMAAAALAAWAAPPRPIPAPASAPTTGPRGLAAAGVFVDQDQGEIVLKGRIAMRHPDIIEYIVCTTGSAEHETIVAADANPLGVRLALMLPPFRLKPGTVARWDDEGRFTPPTGPPVLVFVEYEDPKTKATRRVRAEEWVLLAEKDPKTGQWSRKPMRKTGFIFAGGAFMKDPETGTEFFLANDDGAIVTIYNRPSSVIDNPQPQGESDENWYPNAEVIPPLGTAVKVILKPAAAAASAPTSRDAPLSLPGRG